MPSSSAPWTVSYRASSPAAWPSVRGRPRFCAHRPLPSMTMATCRGMRRGSSASRSTPGRYRWIAAVRGRSEERIGPRRLLRVSLVPEPAEGARAALPVGRHLHHELEEGPLGQLLPHRGPDRLEHRAAPADHDPLLGLPLHEDL